jgi:transposase-like protein
LSCGDLKKMAHERGLALERSTIMRWVHEYSPEIESGMEKMRMIQKGKESHSAIAPDQSS